MAFTVDWGAGPGGMQHGRGHRKIIHKSDYRVTGFAMLPRDGGAYSVTQVLGTRKDGRFAGGVAYVDRNANGFYDIGEGKGGVTISLGSRRTTIWKSGAYALAVGSTSGGILIARWEELQYSTPCPPGKNNIKFDFVIQPQQEYAVADRLIDAVERIDDASSNAKKRFGAAIRLYLAAQDLHLDEPRAARVKALTDTAVQELLTVHISIRQALASSDSNRVQQLVKDNRGRYQPTAADAWLK